MTGKDKYSRFGVGQNVRRAWMDAALACVLDGRPAAESRKRLSDMVCSDSTKTGTRGKESAAKVVGMLASWFAPKEDMGKFVRLASGCAMECLESEIAALHWAVLSGTYPFLLEVSSYIGQLLKLQGSVTKTQLVMRCEERHGTSTTIGRNLEYALWNLAELGLIVHGDRGAYVAMPRLSIRNEHVALLLWKSLLHGTKGGAMSVSRLRKHQALFPFDMPDIDPRRMTACFDDVECESSIGVGDTLRLTPAFAAGSL